MALNLHSNAFTGVLPINKWAFSLSIIDQRQKVFIFQCFESQNCYVTDCILTISINGCSQTFCTFFNTGLDIKGIVYGSK